MNILLDPYAARGCPVKTFNAFDPTAVRVAAPLDDSLRESFDGGADFRDSVFTTMADSPGVVDLRSTTDRCAATLSAMAAGVSAIIGCSLPIDQKGHRRGHPDALVRGTDQTDGTPGYWPVRFKPYRVLEGQTGAKDLRTSTLTAPTQLEPLPHLRFRAYRQGALLELAHHWRLLQACGFAAGTVWGGIVGRHDNHEQRIAWIPLDARFLRTFSRTAASGHTLRSALERYDHEHGFRVYVAEQASTRVPGDDRPPVVRPIRVPECEWCAWWQTCRPRMDDDDISLRISKTPLDVRELQALLGLGIKTVSQLAEADIESLLPRYLPETAHRDHAESRLRIAARRARMLKRGVALEQVTCTPIAVPQAPIEVDLDIETDDSGRTYLWGVLVTHRGTRSQRYQHFSSFTALDADQEVELAARFARWLVQLLAEHPETKVFHYSDYEVVHLRRLAARSAHPDLNAVVGLIRAHFVDLFLAIKDNFVGVDGLGLKVVASKGAGFSWRDEEPGGLNSQLWFATATTDPSPEARDAARTRVLEYNEDDVLATWAVREWLHKLDRATLSTNPSDQGLT